MRKIQSYLPLVAFSVMSLMLNACTNQSASNGQMAMQGQTRTAPSLSADYSSRVPSHIATHEKTVVVDPRVHVWAAYDASGNLVKSGLASAGSDYCPDLGRRCHTSVGTFRVNSLGSPSCKSSLFPKPHGGAPMPYCMFFNGNQALHGSPSSHVVDGNVSHGCVRMQVGDAEWLRYNFVNVGTKVIVRPYN